MSGDGTLIDVGLPMTLSEHPFNRWCATASADLTALRLSARVYYQWCWFLGCGSRNTLFSLGSWSVISWNWILIERCGSLDEKMDLLMFAKGANVLNLELEICITFALSAKEWANTYIC